MVYTEAEEKIIRKNMKEIVRFINDEIQPKLRDFCSVTFRGTYDRYLYVSPKDLRGMTGALYYDFSEEPRKGHVSVFWPRGFDYSIDLMRNWPQVKRELLDKVAEQDTSWLNDFAV